MVDTNTMFFACYLGFSTRLTASAYGLPLRKSYSLPERSLAASTGSCRRGFDIFSSSFPAVFSMYSDLNEAEEMSLLMRRAFFHRVPRTFVVRHSLYIPSRGSGQVKTSAFNASTNITPGMDAFLCWLKRMATSNSLRVNAGTSPTLRRSVLSTMLAISSGPREALAWSAWIFHVTILYPGPHGSQFSPSVSWSQLLALLIFIARYSAFFATSSSADLKPAYPLGSVSESVTFHPELGDVVHPPRTRLVFSDLYAFRASMPYRPDAEAPSRSLLVAYHLVAYCLFVMLLAGSPFFP